MEGVTSIIFMSTEKTHSKTMQQREVRHFDATSRFIVRIIIVDTLEENKLELPHQKGCAGKLGAKLMGVCKAPPMMKKGNFDLQTLDSGK